MVNRKIYFLFLIVTLCQCAAAHAQSAESAGGAADALSQSIGGALKGIGRLLSSITSPKGQQLEDLVGKKNYDAAAKLYEQEKDFFQEKRADYQPLLKELADGLNASKAPTLLAMAERLGSYREGKGALPDSWAVLKADLARTRQLIKEYEGISILRESEFSSSAVAIARGAVAKIEEAYSRDANNAFTKIDHLSTNFFDVYPVALPKSQIMKTGFDALLPALSSATTQQLTAFRTRYSTELDDNHLAALGRLYTAKLIGQESGFFEKRDAVRAARADGYHVTLQDAGISVMNIITPDAGDETIVPELTQDGDLPITTIKASDLEVASLSTDYVILVRLYPTRSSRRIISKSEEQSTVEVGTTSSANPAYTEAQARFIQAQSEYNAQRYQNATTPSYGWGAAIARGLAEGVYAAAVNKARQDMQSVPPTIQQPILKNYTFNVSQVEVTRDTNARIWVVDRVKGTAARQDVPRSEKKEFRIAYNVQEKDPNRFTYKSRYDTEESLDKYEKERTSFTASWLLEEVAKAAPTFESAPNQVAVIQDAVATPSEFGPSLTASTPNPNRAAFDDPRVTSVVVIKSPRGSLGAGFFVAPQIILTNQHVVEGSNMAEVKLRDGTQVTGRVLKTDPGLDLALLQIPNSGPAVVFANFPVTSGTTVEAIGHPSGLEFSMTRGIVSAVRKMANPLVAGAPEMMVIQTDAAISPGNSGGPLFSGNQVIGINTQKLVRRGVEGVGFAVHYTEVLRFLQ